MESFRVERQKEETQLKSSTRILHTHNLRLSSASNFHQGNFPFIMEGGDPLGAAEVMKKKFEDFSLRPTLNNELHQRHFGNLLSFDLDSKMKMFNQLDPSHLNGTTTTTIQGGLTKGGIFAARTTAFNGNQIPCSTKWSQSFVAEPNSTQDSLNSDNRMNEDSPQPLNSKGIPRSFSSSPGFPSPLELESHQHKSVEIPALHNFISPFRKAQFGFRNFDRPLWKDFGGNDEKFFSKEASRRTWDPSTLLSMKNSSAHLQFSTSQQTFFQSTNGSIRAFKDERVVLRQSYGASESESEEDEEEDHMNIKGLSYEPKPGLSFIPKLTIADKPHEPQYQPSEIDDTSSVATNDLDQSPRNSVIGDIPKTPEHRKCFKVAQELLTTERTYVGILHLIDQVFHFRVDQENRASPMFPLDIVTQMFCNIKSLYRLHHDHLLPQLEKRIENWDEDPRIGDLMKDFAPFLKMYSEFVQNFDNSINLINVYREKNSKFANIINEIQKMEECANLPIQHHLIGPIQRIPRYRLLLEAYLRRLPEDSPDLEDTTKALEIVTKAAEHANEAMRRIAGFKKLLEVQEKIKGAVDLVSPTRILLKEGRLFKISARTSDHQERYIFLFSDIILLCSMRTMANRMISSAPYQLRAKLDVAEMSVNEGDDLEVANTFYIQDPNKRIELYTQTVEEKREWMEAMWQARQDLLERKSSLRLGSISPSDEELGIKEPAMIKSDSVSKCMECHVSFTMLKRRHHCHSCGGVVCAKCSGGKYPLQYTGGKPCRVCNTCKTVLQKKEANLKKAEIPQPPSPDEPEKLRGVLDVPTSVPSVLSGSLHLRVRGKKEWNQRWFALRSDFVLYCYEKETDERAMTATPIPGLNISLVEDLPKSESNGIASGEKQRAFRTMHSHGRKSFYFLAPNREEALKWVEKLNMAGNAELTDNNQP